MKYTKTQIIAFAIQMNEAIPKGISRAIAVPFLAELMDLAEEMRALPPFTKDKAQLSRIEEIATRAAEIGESLSLPEISVARRLGRYMMRMNESVLL